MNDLPLTTDPVKFLRQASTVRARAHHVLDLARAGKAKHFHFNESKIADAVALTVEVTRRNYPDLKIPYHSRWQHFSAGGVDRAGPYLANISDRLEKGRAAFELVITSVLLDAGAGAAWAYSERGSDRVYTRSEGLAVASFYAYKDGIYSSQKGKTNADSKGLARFGDEALARAFQVSEQNPLLGLEGRRRLVSSLSDSIKNNPTFFPGPEPRLGYLFDYVLSLAVDHKIRATQVLDTLLKVFANIWPGRITLSGENLGDVWQYAGIKTNDSTNGLIPFHKLSQWLSYSLFEPLEWHGLEVTGIGELTGLPEYRNGGLLIDTGVLSLKDPTQLQIKHLPSSELVVEWRALTVALLDDIAAKVRKTLGLSEEDFPLAKVLQGGTWAAGRTIAARLRDGGTPPLQIDSDGTVF